MDENRGLDRFWETLEEAHQTSQEFWQVRPKTEAWLQGLLAALFPHFWTDSLGPCRDVTSLRAKLARDLSCLLPMTGLAEESQPEVERRFWSSLPEVYGDLLEDAKALDTHDPASESVEEVMIAYPGFLAISVHRLAHVLCVLGVPLMPRLMAEWAHRQTGIDIHPGANISSPFIIDHGTGVVVGETTVIGPGVKLYQGVTLGAVSVKKELAETKRHPTIEEGVVIYAGATILGGRTVIGRGSIIAGGAFITSSVPPESLVTRSSEVRPLSKGALSEFLAFGEYI